MARQESGWWRWTKYSSDVIARNVVSFKFYRSLWDSHRPVLWISLAANNTSSSLVCHEKDVSNSMCNCAWSLFCFAYHVNWSIFNWFFYPKINKREKKKTVLSKHSRLVAQEPIGIDRKLIIMLKYAKRALYLHADQLRMNNITFDENLICRHFHHNYIYFLFSLQVMRCIHSLKRVLLNSI